MKLTIFAAACLQLILLAACAQGPTRQSEAVFYPPLPQAPRVQFLTSFSTEDEFAGKSSNQFREFLLGEEPQSGKILGRPFSIAHRQGQIVIADKTYRKILILDLEERTFDYIKDANTGALQDPVGLFIAPNGEMFVADGDRNQIFVFNQRDEFVRRYGDGTTFRPMDVVVYGDRVYVCDINGSEVEVLDRTTGELIDIIGGIGVEEGLLQKPTHLALDAAGNLFVTDSFNLRVQMFDSQGDFVKVIGWNEMGPGGFVRPKGLDVDRDGHLYSADAAFQILQIFSVETRAPLLFFGKFGTGPGGTYMPSDVHIDYDNVSYFSKYADPQFELEYLIYVGNLLGKNKLNVYGFGHWTGESEDRAAAPAGPATATESVEQQLAGESGQVPDTG